MISLVGRWCCPLSLGSRSVSSLDANRPPRMTECPKKLPTTRKRPQCGKGMHLPLDGGYRTDLHQRPGNAQTGDKRCCHEGRLVGGELGCNGTIPCGEIGTVHEENRPLHNVAKGCPAEANAVFALVRARAACTPTSPSPTSEPSLSTEFWPPT